MLSNTCETLYFRLDKMQCNKGTPQGELVAVVPLFLLLHLNEMSNVINERTKRLVFADGLTRAGKLQELDHGEIVL